MKLHALPGVRGLGIDGVELLNDKDGCIDVADHLVAAACAAGYALTAEEAMAPLVVMAPPPLPPFTDSAMADLKE